MMIEKVKLALRITTDAYNEEIADLIAAAMVDLGIGDIDPDLIGCGDPLIKRAVITYCKMNFGQSDDYDRLKASYTEQKAQLGMNSNYTDWGGLNGQK